MAIKDELKMWIKKLAEELNLHEYKLEQFEVLPKGKDKKLDYKGNPYLLVIVEPKLSQSSSKNEFNLSAELLFERDLRDTQKNTEVQRIDLNENQYIQANREDIWKELYQLIERCNRILWQYNNPIRLTIELFLPKQYLVKFCPEIQKIPTEENDPPWFGSEYKLILRSYDRFSNHGYRQKLLIKWNQFSDLIQNTPNSSETTIKDRMICLSQINQSYNWKELSQEIENKIGININLPLLGEAYSCHINNFLESLIRYGISFFILVKRKMFRKLKVMRQ